MNTSPNSFVAVNVAKKKEKNKQTNKTKKQNKTKKTELD